MDKPNVERVLKVNKKAMLLIILAVENEVNTV